MDKLGIALSSSPEDLKLADQIRHEMLAESLAVLEKYFMPHIAQREFLALLSKYYSGIELMQQAYLFLSRFYTYESFINQLIGFLLNVTYEASLSLPLSNLFATTENPQITGYKTDQALLKILEDEARHALSKYSWILQIDKAFTLDVRETDKSNGVFEIMITWVFIPMNTRHNYVHPVYITR